MTVCIHIFPNIHYGGCSHYFSQKKDATYKLPNQGLIHRRCYSLNPVADFFVYPLIFRSVCSRRSLLQFNEFLQFLFSEWMESHTSNNYSPLLKRFLKCKENDK